MNENIVTTAADEGAVLIISTVIISSLKMGEISNHITFFLMCLSLCLDFNDGGDYLGCFKDDRWHRALKHESLFSREENSVDWCIRQCQSKKRTYAGVKYRSECFCGDNHDYNRYNTSADCFRYRCPGNNTQSCGGNDGILIYSVCPKGYFTQPTSAGMCQNACNCKRHSDICLFKSGSCPNGCAYDWKGPACNISCDVDNGGCAHICQEEKETDWCSCHEGYIKYGPGHMLCEDFDECIENDGRGPCSHDCNNTLGSFTCLCPDGYMLSNITHCMVLPSSAVPQTTGIIIGVVVAAVLLVILVLVIIMVRRHRKSGKLSDTEQNKQQDSTVFVEQTSQLDIQAKEMSAEPGPEQKPEVPKNKPKLPASSTRKEEDSISVASSTVTEDELEAPGAENRSCETLANDGEANIPPSKFTTRAELQEYVEDIQQDTEILKAEFQEIPTVLATYSEAKNEALKKKNCFKNILPYDQNRVKLEKIKGTKLSDYINASYVKGYNNNDIFIASHGPTIDTINDFWRMVWEKKVVCIVMVTNLVEEGKRKCQMYWPESGSQSFGDIKVTLVSEAKWPEYTIRKLLVTDGSSRTEHVTQLHYTGWPDHSVPRGAASLLHFHRKMREAMTSEAPTLVHCSAGVGRTGTLLAMDWLLLQAQSEGGVDIYNCVHNLRQNRMNMVQTLDQYIFLHTTLLEALMVGNTAYKVENFPQLYTELTKGSQSPLQTQFKMLQSMYPAFKPPDTQIAMSCENSEKNQSNIVPADSNIVHLITPFSGRNNYINAVFVSSYSVKNSCIATQWPLAGTKVDFWRMVIDHEVSVVLVLEDLKLQDSFPSFMPTRDKMLDFSRLYVVNNGDSKLGDLTLTSIGVWKSKSPELNTVYANAMEMSEDCHNVTVALAGPADMDSETSLRLSTIKNLMEVRETTGLGERAITLLVCRDGAHLCGLYLAASNMIDMINTEKELDIFYIVQQLKTARSEFVVSETQFGYLHGLADEYLINV